MILVVPCSPGIPHQRNSFGNSPKYGKGVPHIDVPWSVITVKIVRYVFKGGLPAVLRLSLRGLVPRRPLYRTPGAGDGGCVSVSFHSKRDTRQVIGPRDSSVWDLLPTMPGCAVFFFCPVVLSAPDTVLIERNLGKRIDPQTRGMPSPLHPAPWSFRHDQ